MKDMPGNNEKVPADFRVCLNAPEIELSVRFSLPDISDLMKYSPLILVINMGYCFF
jgi:hypothetical protein